MNSRMQIMLLIVLLSASLVAACSGPEPSKQPAQTSSQPKAAPAPSAPSASSSAAEQVTTGKIQNVDLAANTLVIKDAAGNDLTFSFTPSTEITGASGTQGLSGQTGSQVTVHHIEQDGRKTAVRIEIVPQTAP